MQALPPAASPSRQLRATAILAAGCSSGFVLLWVLRGLPLGGVLMWLAPLPLYACALAFGAGASALAAGVAALSLLGLHDVSAMLAHVLSVGLPVVLSAWIALAVPPGSAPRLGPPVVALALLAAGFFLAAAVAMAGHEGGMHGALRATFMRAFAEAGAPTDAPLAQLADLLARVVPLAIGLWFLLAMAMNTVLAQRLVNRFGLLVHPPVLFSALVLPRWYAALPVAALVVALLLPQGPRYAAGGAAEILALPFFLLGLTLVHGLARTTNSPRGWLVAFYIALFIFSAPVLFAVTGAGFADHFGNLRGRIAARANSRPQRPPEDRNT
jgi:hypothetical protein